jgi:hypothetical protein
LDNKAKEKIEFEISRIQKLITDSKPLLELCRLKKPDFIEITATAQILHSFYNGIESVIILFLKNIGLNIPNDITWHKTLFEIMFGNNIDKTVIIRQDLKEQMGKYLYFRHFIRHSYSSELIWDDMEILVKNLEELWDKVKEDFELFLKNN